MKITETEIGTFQELSGKNYPKFEAFEMDAKQKKIILDYLENTPHVAESPSLAIDVFTKERRFVPIAAQSDGKYIWRSDIAYYFDKYNLKLPEEFIDHVLNQTH